MTFAQKIARFVVSYFRSEDSIFDKKRPRLDGPFGLLDPTPSSFCRVRDPRSDADNVPGDAGDSCGDQSDVGNAIENRKELDIEIVAEKKVIPIPLEELNLLFWLEHCPLPS